MTYPPDFPSGNLAMNERPKPTELAADAFNTIVARKKQREADIASGKIEPPRAPSLARTVVVGIAPGQEERLLALLAMLSDVTLPELKSASLKQISDMLAAAAKEEGWERVDIPLAAPARSRLAWQDANDADHAPFFDVLQRLFGEYIKDAETGGVGDDPVADAPAASAGPVIHDLVVPAEYARVAPLVIIRLQFPFAVDGKRIAVVSLHPPAYATIQAVTKGEITRIDLVASMAGLSADMIRVMRCPDAERVVAIALDLCPDFDGV
jgi:hypothetical protein